MKNQFLESVKKIYEIFQSHNPWGTAPEEDEFDDPKDLELIKKLIAPTDYKTFADAWRSMHMDAGVDPVEYVDVFNIKSAEDFARTYNKVLRDALYR